MKDNDGHHVESVVGLPAQTARNLDDYDIGSSIESTRESDGGGNG